MNKMNTAQRLYQSLGLIYFTATGPKRSPSHTKRGPGRRHRSGKQAARGGAVGFHL